MSTLVSILFGVVLNALGVDMAQEVNNDDTTFQTEVVSCRDAAQEACPAIMEAHYIISKNELLSQKK